MKSKSKFKATLLTMIFTVFNTIVVSILGLVYNNLIIKYYGSSINGLISTLTQFVSLFTIFEGGFSVAAVVSSYDSIVNKDYKKLNSILYTTRKYLKKVTCLFSVVVFLAGLAYLYFIDSPLSMSETIGMLVISILTTSVSMAILSSYTIVLSGHNAGYITSLISTISKTLVWLISFSLILNKVNILLIYLFNLISIVINVLVLRQYIKKKFDKVTYVGKYDKELIKGTKDVLFQKIASTIFSSTDLALISAGISFAMASVYNLYNQIFHVVLNFLTSIIEAPFNSFGQLFSNGETEKINKIFKIFEKCMQIISTVFLTTAGMSILGFVSIYTKNVYDINYVIPSLVLLFYSQFFIQLNNRPYGLILNASGNFKMQNVQCALSVIINLVVSVVLMKYIGVNGIVVGSILGTLIILILNVYQCYKYIIDGNYKKNIINLIMNYLMGLSLIVLTIYLKVVYDNYIIWIFGTTINFFISSLVVLIINIILDRKQAFVSIGFFFDKFIGKD